MDPYGHIYRAPEDAIPEEDKARLDGYLTAKAEEGELERMKAQHEQKFARLLGEHHVAVHPSGNEPGCPSCAALREAQER